jgi:hypothetical protein
VARSTAITPAADAVFAAGLLDVNQVRSAAWNRLGIEYRPDSPLAEYARRHDLGRPVTQEFVTGDLIAQGFAGGIVYAPLATPANVQHVGW